MKLLWCSVLVLSLAAHAWASCKWEEVQDAGVWGQNDRILKGQTKEQCMAACENEKGFHCNSVEWNPNKECHLTKADRYNTVLDTGFLSKNWVYLERKCTEDPRDDSKCPLTGPINDWTIGGYNKRELRDQSPEQCKQACLNENTFHCKSFEYKPSTRQCNLHMVGRETVTLTSWPGWVYYEIDCYGGCAGGQWQGPVVGLGISGNNLKQINNVDLATCKRLCQEQITFHCRSFDYRRAYGTCYLQTVTADDVALTSWRDYDYYEISGCNGAPLTTIRTGSCYCQGDPHCFSFDGKRSDYQGSCKYVLAQDNCKNGVPNGKPTWQVINNNNKNYPTANVAYVKEVTVILDTQNLVIDIFAGGSVVINGERCLGFPQTPHDDVTISKSSNRVYVTVTGGIQVTYDGSSLVTVNVPDSAKENTCGLCGNFNGNQADDWTIGDSEVCMDKYPTASAGQVTNNLNLFGASWTASIDQTDASCVRECPNPPPQPTCDNVKEQKAGEHCKVLKDISGPFAECLVKMDALQRQDLYDNCVYDSCHLNNFETVVCEHGASMALVCQNMFEVTATWRSESLCPMECGENMEYKPCGSACMPSCKDQDGTGCGDMGGCEEGCFCKDGFVYDGQSKCFAKEQCGCKVPDQGDVYVNVGTSFMTKDCGKKCVCEKTGGDLVCTAHECAANKKCDLRDGVQACFCDLPFVNDGAECEELVNPCKADNNPLSCMTCTGATEDKCDSAGKMEACADGKDICSTVTTNVADEVTEVTKGCAVRDECPAGSVGPDGNSCASGPDDEVCTQCLYGLPGDTHSCVKPTVPVVTTCDMDKDEGTGSKMLERYFYDKAQKKCRTMDYRGQGGNANNFSTKNKCEQACKYANIPAECKLSKDAGEGDMPKKKNYRYFFDTKKGLCKKFKYTGTGGNENNFESKSDCTKNCK